jgi:hypothetical protein
MKLSGGISPAMTSGISSLRDDCVKNIGNPTLHSFFGRYRPAGRFYTVVKTNRPGERVCDLLYSISDNSPRLAGHRGHPR